MSQVLDHLWQSTLLALGLALLALAFRRTSAAVRHGLWFSASLKFLVPFAALAALGRLVGPAIPLPEQAKPEAVFIAEAAQPFSQPALPQGPLSAFPFARGPELQAPIEAAMAQPPAHAAAAAAAIHAAPRLDLGLILLAVWALGSAAVLAGWAVRWSRLRKVLRTARPLDWPAPMPVLAAPSLVEPGLVGLWRPVLLVPETLPDQLCRPEIEALVAHEACHLRRRDNLTAAVHMLVEALFWFHPLVWWIGARLIDERERACDEAVLRAGHDRAAYARSLVEICRLYLQSPLDCVAGASGSSLKTRVEAIMSAPPALSLSRSKKALLLAAGVCAVATPVAAGLLTTPEGHKAVARAAALASRAAPALIAPAEVQAAETAPDASPAAKPVVLAQNESILAPGLTIARSNVAAAPLAGDAAAPRIDQAPAQAPAAPADTKAQAASFVDFHAATDQHVLARWRGRICVRIVGLEPQQAASVKARVEAVAKGVGVVSVSGCRPNIEIGFTNDPQGTLDSVMKGSGLALGDRTSDTKNSKTVTRPVQAWYQTNGLDAARNDYDANSLKVPVLWQNAERNWSPTPFSGVPSDDQHRSFSNVLVIVDLRRTADKSLGLMADYVSMLALSEPRARDACAPLPSITDLFVGACSGHSAPDGLTSADAAYLTALYEARTTRTADVSERMASILAADPAARADAAPAQPVRPASAVTPATPPRLSLTRLATDSQSDGAKRAVSAFAQSYGEAFWNTDRRICVKVEGLPSDKAAAVKSRVEADARAVGVSVGRAQCSLHYDVEIRFATDADRAVRDVLNYYRNPVFPLPMDRPQGADRPIRAWYGMVYDFAGGTGRRGLGANPSARTKFALAIVVVDPERTKDMNLDLVSDYVAKLGLSQPRALDKCNVLPSITDLFAGACPGRAAPTGLTPPDMAFLRALYTGSPGIRATRSPSEFADLMTRLLTRTGSASVDSPAPAVQPAMAPTAPPRLLLTPIALTTRPAAALAAR